MAARTGKAKLAGVIGSPVGHSLSPALHEYWLRSYDIDGAYIPLEVPGGMFKETLHHFSALGFQGFNVTLPYKQEAFAAVAAKDEMARLTGAVNTLVRLGDGTFAGKNTDVEGFLENLRAHNVVPEKLQRAVILGAGGAARAIAVGLALAGCGEIVFINRTRQKAEELIGQLKEAGCPGSFLLYDWEERTNAISGADLLVNTTQLGMVGQPALELELNTLPPSSAICDIIYNPLETPLITEGRARGHRVIGGLGMLLYQAVPGFEAWFGVRPAVTPELSRYIASLVAP